MSNSFESSKVAMFPSAYRKAEHRGKFASERNFVNIINSIVDRDCYVLSTAESLSNNMPLQVVLHGYYFEVEDFDISSNEFRTCRFAIKVEKGAYALVNFDTSATTEEAIDDGSYFKGLVYKTGDTPFTEDDTEHYDYYQLQVSSGGQLVNQVRLSSNSVFFDSNDSNKGKSVTYMLNSKQNNLTADTTRGIDQDKLNNNQIALTNQYNSTLASLKSKGNVDIPIFVDSSGLAQPISATSGHTQKVEMIDGHQYSYVQAALIDGGALKDTGVRLFASRDYPQDGVGRNGDIWFKYS